VVIDLLPPASQVPRIVEDPEGIRVNGGSFVASAASPDIHDHLNTDALFSLLYSELHRLAKRQLARQYVPAQLGATTLLHEAYVNMAKGADPSFPDRPRFMGYAARVMRGLIIDHARAHSSAKKGGRYRITALTLDTLENPVDARELSAISDALEELAAVEPELATLVDLKFFCGFSFAEMHPSLPESGTGLLRKLCGFQQDARLGGSRTRVTSSKAKPQHEMTAKELFDLPVRDESAP
jgi:RNA polymerase sigma factor (TIGR02999 family)